MAWKGRNWVLQRFRRSSDGLLFRAAGFDIKDLRQTRNLEYFHCRRPWGANPEMSPSVVQTALCLNEHGYSRAVEERNPREVEDNLGWAVLDKCIEHAGEVRGSIEVQVADESHEGVAVKRHNSGREWVEMIH